MVFRAHEAGDEAAFVAMHTDAEVRRYVGGRAWGKEEAVERFRRGWVGRPKGKYGLWATIIKETGEYIGSCGLSHPQTVNGPRLGYYIARQYWGRGLATEASRAFLEYGFQKLRLKKIYADVEKGHAASERILRKLGFEWVSEEKIAGSARVICVYRLTKEEKADHR
jgi:[ribosomal protein S5]-alanine N-acetyltransferase